MCDILTVLMGTFTLNIMYLQPAKLTTLQPALSQPAACNLGPSHYRQMMTLFDHTSHR